MPGQDGLTATRRIREVAPNAVVAVVTAHRDQDWIIRAAQAGACAFIPKNGSLSEMIDVLRRVRPGRCWSRPRRTRRATTARRPKAGVGTVRSSPGASWRYSTAWAAACRPRRSPGCWASRVETCRGYMKSVHAKLGVRSQLEAVIKAQELQLLGSVP